MRRLRKMRFLSPWCGGGVCARFEAEGDAGDAPAGGAGTHWLDTDPEYAAIAKDPDSRAVVEKYKTRADEVKGHIELHRQFRHSFRVPEQLDSLEEGERTKIKGRIAKILGAREKPEEYELKRPQMPEGLPYDEESEKALRAWAVKYGVPQAAVAELYEDHNNRMLARYAAEIREIDDLWKGVEKTMVDKHGKDEWHRRMGLVKAFFAEWAPKAGFKHEDIVAGLLEAKDGAKLTPLMAALAEFVVVAQAEGLTKLGGVNNETGKIDVNQRWPNSAALMQG